MPKTLGTLIGAFVMGLLSNGSDLLGISPYWQQAIIGAVIINHENGSCKNFTRF